MTRRLFGAAAIGTALLAMACGGSSGSSTASTPTPAPQTVTFTESEFKIDASSTTLKPGTYIFTAANDGKFPHDLHVATPDGSELGHSEQITTGQTSSFQVSLKAGTYTLFCAVPGHRARGMETKITVS
jgi:plastocyanin